METEVHVNMNEESSQTLKGVAYRCINLFIHKEILRRKNLKVHSIINSLDEIWEETKTKDLARALKIGTLRNRWPQMWRLGNDFMGKLYLRSITPVYFGSRWRKSGDCEHIHPDNIHHFCLVYGIDGDIPNHHIDRRNKSLDKA